MKIGDEHYLAFKRIKDKLIALDPYNTLTTWDITTGKVFKIHRLENSYNFDGFSHYKYDNHYN
jgi:hypothetical protein